MALRKEDVDDNDRQAENPKKRSRITFDVSPELRRRIKVAALQNDLSIGEYLGRILEQAVPGEGTSPRQRRPATRRMSEELRQVREAILQDHHGQPFEDSTEMIRQMREERSQYLADL